MPKKRSQFRNRAEAALVTSTLEALECLSPEKAERLGRRLGGAFRFVARGRRELARRNLVRAFPAMEPEGIDRILREVFAHFGGVAAVLARSLSLPSTELMEWTTIANPDVARDAMNSRRGVLLVSSHLGNWEMGAIAMATLGPKVTVVVRPLDNPYLDALLTRFREKTGNRVLSKREAAREIFRVLRSGGAVGIVADQHARPPDAVVVPFLGRPASTTTAVARFADRTEALILPGNAIRTGPARYRLVFDEPLDVRTLSEAERTPEALTSRINGLLERQILESPEQWLWLHNRWRQD